MLDNETKRRIDTARDILVGKIPDPKSQVEHITIALIYKFMDDMDAQSEEMGGKRSFFAGDFAKYGWARLMAPGLGGYDLLNLYGEAISRMQENPGVPTLFRDIFKNAYLPYRDPETLKSFLKIINDFSYDHSEKLGDAFEYLLSVLGSQGDAGQFRTPRHIIDFMVEIIDPQKHESILDPACGTAGFLISAYKQIMQANAKEGRPGAALTPDERSRMLNHIQGYDISPDMVRLSLANLYLHGFPNPHIDEYDTLTNTDKWNTYFDIVLANPPFMSPKGGIRPHNRFSVASNRSEVLFVDYIAEHLSPNGRAAVIVPEGVIFQSQNAYKQLRKMLVDNYLVGVISLPAGVFNPYSGVKTSILWLDKSLARKSDSILFVKIEQDGYDLGAQRRENSKNDLPDALRGIQAYKASVIAGAHFDTDPYASLTLVAKAKVAENGDYNLSGERYREVNQRVSQYPHVELGEVVEILDSLRRPITKSDRKPGPYPYYGATGVLDYVEGYIFDEPLVLVGEDGAKWGPGENSAFFVEGKVWVNNHAHVLRPKRDKLLDRFLIEMLNEADLMSYVTGVTVPKLNQERLRSIKIPLPPLSVQEEIVAEIESYQKIIDGARQVVDNYQPRIDIDPDWPVVEFPEVVFFQEGPGIRNWQFTTNGVKLLNVKNIVGDRIILDNSDKYISHEEFRMKYSHFLIEDGDIIIASSGATYGKNALFCDSGFPVIVNTSTIRIHPKDTSRILQGYIKLFLDSDSFKWQIDRLITGSAQPNFGPSHLKQVKIPLAPLTIQQTIVAEIGAEQALVAANRELIERFEQKIQKRIAKVWGE